MFVRHPVPFKTALAGGVYRGWMDWGERDDGDTQSYQLDVGFSIASKPRLRLVGLNCPELSTPEGQMAAAFTRSMMGIAVVARTFATFTDMRQSFERYLGDVWIVWDGQVRVLADVVVAEGYGSHISRQGLAFTELAPLVVDAFLATPA